MRLTSVQLSSNSCECAAQYLRCARRRCAGRLPSEGRAELRLNTGDIKERQSQHQPAKHQCPEHGENMANAYLQGVEISASQFLDIFHHYDNDGNGYIEGKELQNFIKELQQARKQAGLELTDKMKAFVEKYEQNADGKIGIIELVQILPTEENFLLFFRQQLKSCAEFMEAWRNYDADHSGYIEADELKNFLKDLLQKAKKPYDEKKLEEYTLTTLKIFDSNKDGKLCLSEMARLLPDQENFLLKFQGVTMARKEFNKIFELYDQDRNGYMDENELDALLKDLCEKNNKVLEVSKIPTYKSAIMALSDGGKLYRTELALVLCAEEM
ncbi:calbindin-like isoform X1 [Myxocyprinus asiaticus]|uniref:calbindin-like isoform X1 n=1 Tax=Myxocyprinus asiaticus TaxID=70543 RepID=UPI00222245BA|nr:calbindin-like isoform X1 [Myxocyprinus asiaticus]